MKMRNAVFIIGIAVVGILCPGTGFAQSQRGSSTDKTPYETDFEIDSPIDVDEAMATTFAPRKPPVDTATLGVAWKAIVTDATREPFKIIFDTDIGTDVDDAISLAFALKRPELDIRAITTSRGEVQQRASIVSRMLKVMGRPEIPYAAGSPVLINRTSPPDKVVNQYPFAGSEKDRPRPAAKDAQELFRRVIMANPGEVWLVVVGPMTNAALLIRDHPEVAAKLKGIVCMGGEPTRPYPETNIRNDPEAAEIVCRSGLLKFTGTYDVTVRMLMPKPDFDRLRKVNTPTAKAIIELNRLWRIQHPDRPGKVIFDMVPMVWLFAPELITTAPMGLTVELALGERRAMMTASPTAPLGAVSTDINAVAVHRLLMDTLTR
jgi:pyrimidine-specific ribonucleoside hydrolase